MGTADALGGLCRFHECALICGCTIGAITFRNRDPKNSPTDLFVWSRTGCRKRDRRN